jgi:microcystin-dependent protein
MACSNCYNGCAEIVSDRCVRYTGIDVPLLGIQNGDSLSYIEATLIEFLTSTINGEGVKPIIDQTIICEVVSKYLPDCGELTLNAYLTALIKAACDLQTQVTVLDARVDVIESAYSIGCLTGVTSTSGTHAILQAVITKLCALDVALAALALDVDVNYVKLADLDTLIQAYLDSTASSTKYYTRMVPYTVVEYYGSLSSFDATGAGLGDWEKIYLCNGQNGTPDKRGRVPVGAIQLVPGGALAAAVNPATPTNPNYALGDTAYGSNSVVLDVTQIPSHTHVLTDPGHTHTYEGSIQPGGGGESSRDGVQATLTTNSSTTGITIASAGGGLGHSNIQPTLACYYIMYIP